MRGETHMYDDGGGRVPVPVDIFSLPVKDDMLPKAFCSRSLGN